MSETREAYSVSGESERLAALYHALGWSLIPIKPGTKVPIGRWKGYQKTRASLETVLGWVAKGYGLGLVCGDVSHGWVCRDFDILSSYQNWVKLHPELTCLPCSRTARGVHVFFRSDVPVEFRKFADGELRSDGHYVCVPPTLHPDYGDAYQWIVEPSDQLDHTDVAATGLGQDFCHSETQDHTDTHDYKWRECTESTESTESLSAISDNPVLLLTVEHREQIEEAIEATAPKGVGHRNDGIWKFARRVIAILGNRRPATKVRDGLAIQWHEYARGIGVIGTQDIGITVADFAYAIRNVKRPDDGSNLVDAAWELAESLSAPWFVQTVAAVSEDSPVVALAKLVTALDQLSNGRPWPLPCRTAERLIGRRYTYRQALRQLHVWASESPQVIEITEHGLPGPKSKKANLYRMIPRR